MNITDYLKHNLAGIIEVARLAPSVHNTQPWRVSTVNATIMIAIDPAHQLVDGDPTGRQTIISLGIFVEAIAIALDLFGLTSKQVLFEESHASITVQPGISEPEASTPDSLLLSKRCTDRSIYEHTSIDQNLIRAIERLSTSDVKVTTVIDRTLIETIAKLTAQGIQLALSSPAFRKELSHYLVLPWSHKKRGIAVKSLYIPRWLALVEPWLIRRGIGLGSEVALEKRRWLSASAVIVIAAAGDMPKYWFEAGRIYLRTSLLVEQQGLSQATSAAVVEASDFHEDIEQLMGTNQRIVSILRIGKGVRKRYHSPRLDPKELITSN